MEVVASLNDGLLYELDDTSIVVPARARSSEWGYCMDLEGGKADGVMELEAVAWYSPLSGDSALLDNEPLTKVRARQEFSTLMTKCEVPFRGPKGVETHVSLMGGKYKIQAETASAYDENRFLKLYAANYLSNNANWMVELRTPVFRYFIDLDFKQPEKLKASQIEQIALVVHDTLAKFWIDKPPLRSVCCTTTYKKEACTMCACPCAKGTRCGEKEGCHGRGVTGKSATGGACEKCGGYALKMKTGVHLIYPELFVNDEQALDVRESIISDCVAAFGARDGALNPWVDVVDNSVYKGRTSLRMIGASKAEKCPCRRAKGKECPQCLGRFNYHINTGRPYAMLFCANANGRRDKAQEEIYKKDYYKLVVDTKIRSSRTEPSAGYQVPEGTTRHGTSRDTRLNKNFEEEREKPAARHENLSYDSPEQEVLQEVFRLHAKYSETIVSSVMRSTGKTSGFIVNVTGKNATFCQNIGRCHRSNRVWFHVTPAGISQRCYDNAEVVDAEMRYGLCKNYKSACFELTPKALGILFPASSEAAEGASIISVPAADTSGNVKMRSLLDAGNKLCKFLYGTDWTSSKRFQNLHGEKLIEIQNTMLEHDRNALGIRVGTYRNFFPGALGVKNAEEVAKTLGFEKVAGKKRSRATSALEEELESLQGVDALVDTAKTTFSTIVGILLNMDESMALDKLHEAKTTGNFVCVGKRTKIVAVPAEFKLIEIT